MFHGQLHETDVADKVTLEILYDNHITFMGISPLRQQHDTVKKFLNYDDDPKMMADLNSVDGHEDAVKRQQVNYKFREACHEI